MRGIECIGYICASYFIFHEAQSQVTTQHTRYAINFKAPRDIQDTKKSVNHSTKTLITKLYINLEKHVIH
jgi:hypothetical protein